MADFLDVIPGLGHYGGRLEQHAEDSERGIHGDQVLGVDAVTLGSKAVTALDTPFGVPAVHAHVPVPRRAGRAWDRIAPAHDADHEVSGDESGFPGGLGHPAERFVPDDEAVLSRRRRPVIAVDDLQVRAADADRLRQDQDRTVLRRRLRHVRQRHGALLPGNDRDGPHTCTLTAGGYLDITRRE
jgi:hypothetical protein